MPSDALFTVLPMAKQPSRIDLLELDIDLRLPTSGARPSTSRSGTSTSSLPSCAPPTARATATPSPRTRRARSATSTGTGSRPAARPSAQTSVSYESRRGPGKRSPARLVVALSVAAVLAVFLLYTSIAGGGHAALQPSELAAHSTGDILLVGTVVGRARGRRARAAACTSCSRDAKGTTATRAGRLPRHACPICSGPAARSSSRERCANGDVRREAGHALDEVPVEVRAGAAKKST